MAAKLQQLSPEPSAAEARTRRQRDRPVDRHNDRPRRAGRLPVVLAAAMLTVAGYALAQELRGDQPGSYTVQRGDTLWDIAGRLLQHPWRWSEIWQANPQVENPNLIYPGDVIRLTQQGRTGHTEPPARLATQPGPRNEAPIDALPLSEIEHFLSDLRVVNDFKQLPHVIALEEDRLRGTQGQLAYVRGLTSARNGDRYVVVRPTMRYSQTRRKSNGEYLEFKEDLDFRGNSLKGETANMDLHWTNAMLHSKSLETLGFELALVNIGTVTRGEVGGAQASTLLLDDPMAEVRPGDRLLPVDGQRYDLQFFPHQPRTSLPRGKVQVMAVASGIRNAGAHDVVAISAGARDGIDNGTVFSLWRDGSRIHDETAARFDRGANPFTRRSKKVQLPDEYAGHVMVFRTFDKVSYGLVMQTIKPVQVGYELKHPDATF